MKLREKKLNGLGLNKISPQSFTVTVIMAGNSKDNPREIPRLLKAIENGYDYVQGSRPLCI